MANGMVSTITGLCACSAFADTETDCMMELETGYMVIAM